MNGWKIDGRKRKWWVMVVWISFPLYFYMGNTNFRSENFQGMTKIVLFFCNLNFLSQGKRNPRACSYSLWIKSFSISYLLFHAIHVLQWVLFSHSLSPLLTSQPSCKKWKWKKFLLWCFWIMFIYLHFKSKCCFLVDASNWDCYRVRNFSLFYFLKSFFVWHDNSNI